MQRPVDAALFNHHCYIPCSQDVPSLIVTLAVEASSESRLQVGGRCHAARAAPATPAGAALGTAAAWQLCMLLPAPAAPAVLMGWEYVDVQS